jgi:hypothetical protein
MMFINLSKSISLITIPGMIYALVLGNKFFTEIMRTINITIALTVLLTLLTFNASTNSGGAPAGHSGSPMSGGNTCSSGSCHSGGTLTTQDFMINTDIPAGGFLPNTNYTITIQANANGALVNRLGFMASVENGGHTGALSTIGGGGTQLTGGNYVTHTASSVLPASGQRVWFFNWNSGNSQAATIYVALNFANGNGTASGDAVMTKTASFMKSTMSLTELDAENMSVFPNPAQHSLHVTFNALAGGKLSVYAYNLGGAKVLLHEEGGSAGAYKNTFDISHLAAGSYILEVRLDDNSHFTRFIKH